MGSETRKRLGRQPSLWQTSHWLAISWSWQRSCCEQVFGWDHLITAYNLSDLGWKKWRCILRSSSFVYSISPVHWKIDVRASTRTKGSTHPRLKWGNCAQSLLAYRAVRGSTISWEKGHQDPRLSHLQGWSGLHWPVCESMAFQDPYTAFPWNCTLSARSPYRLGMVYQRNCSTPLLAFYRLRAFAHQCQYRLREILQTSILHGLSWPSPPWVDVFECCRKQFSVVFGQVLNGSCLNSNSIDAHLRMREKFIKHFLIWQEV